MPTRLQSLLSRLLVDAAVPLEAAQVPGAPRSARDQTGVIEIAASSYAPNPEASSLSSPRIL